MPDWFRHVPVSPVDKRIRARLRYQYRTGEDYNISKEKSAPRPMPLYRIYRGYGKLVKLGGKKIKLFGAYDLAKIYKLRPQTIRYWYDRGFLPEPFITKKIGRGTAFFYTTEQVRVICRVLNDIFSQGVKNVSIKWHKEHAKMMQMGCDYVLENISKIPRAKVKREYGGKIGVRWVE